MNHLKKTNHQASRESFRDSILSPKRPSAILALVLMLFMLTVIVGGCTQSGDEARQQIVVESLDEAPGQAEAGTQGQAGGGKAAGMADRAADNNDSSEAVREPATTIELTDMMGREIKLDAPAERIVVLAASDCEILYAIGAGETLVGRGEYCDYPEEIFNVPSVQSGSETNIEQIIALQPQVVVMSIMSQTKEQVAALESAGIKVVAMNAQDIESVYTAIELLGKVVGRSAEASILINDMKTAFTDISTKAVNASASASETETIYFEVSPLEYGIWTAGSDTFMNELAAMLGMKNAFEDIQGWGEISQEQVIERDPDHIVTIAMYFGEGKTPVEEIMGREGWQGIKAIKNKMVLNVDSNEISRPGPRLTKALSAIYEFIYEEN